MRKIKFRGKAKMSILNDMYFEHDNGWFYGNLVMYGDTPYIVGDFIEVDTEYTINEFWVAVHPESVGQYTGLDDKHGNPIYEGDIVSKPDTIEAMSRLWDEMDDRTPKEIQKHEIAVITNRGYAFFCGGTILNHHVSTKANELEVIGNIYEDKHLLKEESK